MKLSAVWRATGWIDDYQRFEKIEFVSARWRWLARRHAEIALEEMFPEGGQVVIVKLERED